MKIKRAPLSLFLLLCPMVGAAEKPNFLVINVDDLGWSDLGCQGSDYYQTPEIDRLAAQGMRFTQGYASASSCRPSRACLLTGQDMPRTDIYAVGPSDHGKSEEQRLLVRPQKGKISEDNLTIADVLSQAGCRTISIGKWHVSSDPTRHGFDENIAGDRRGNLSSRGKDAGAFHSPFDMPNLNVAERGSYMTDLLTDAAMTFMEENRNEPWFVYLPYYAVHTPLDAKADKLSKYRKLEGTDAHDNPAYAAMIETVDDNVGRLKRKLEELGLSERTLIIFTSDNGGLWRVSKQWPLRAGKGSYYEGGIRVPFIAYWPGTVPAGAVSDVPVAGIDLFPTFLAAAGVEKPAQKVLDGADLMPVLTGELEQLERPLFWHFPIYMYWNNPEGRDPKYIVRPGSAIRLGKWKLIENFDFQEEPVELYDLEADPGEHHNLASEHPDIAERLLGRLKAWRERIDAFVPHEPNPAFRHGRGSRIDHHRRFLPEGVCGI